MVDSDKLWVWISYGYGRIPQIESLLFPQESLYCNQTCLYLRCIFIKQLREGLKKNKNGWIHPSWLAGWGQQGAKIQLKKILFSNKNTKMIRMV